MLLPTANQNPLFQQSIATLLENLFMTSAPILDTVTMHFEEQVRSLKFCLHFATQNKMIQSSLNWQTAKGMVRESIGKHMRVKG